MTPQPPDQPQEMRAGYISPDRFWGMVAALRAVADGTWNVNRAKGDFTTARAEVRRILNHYTSTAKFRPDMEDR